MKYLQFQDLLSLPILFLFALISQNCTDTYTPEIKAWQEQRFDDLKAPYSWPSVVGLFPLQDSLSTFGSNEENDIYIEKGPEYMGSLFTHENGVTLKITAENKVKIDDQELVFSSLRTDRHEEGASFITYQSLQAHIIDREGAYFLRVKDTLSRYRKALTEIPYYPIDKNYRIKGKVDPNLSSDAVVTYKNILGMDISNPIAAVILFDWKGERYSLTAIESDEDHYMVMVHDETTGEDTYGGGRYLYPQKADQNGIVYLDFNKLENPPCVFTPYATCPLPPKANHLPFKIEAGEKILHLY